MLLCLSNQSSARGAVLGSHESFGTRSMMAVTEVQLQTPSSSDLLALLPSSKRWDQEPPVQLQAQMPPFFPLNETVNQILPPLSSFRQTVFHLPRKVSIISHLSQVLCQDVELWVFDDAPAFRNTASLNAKFSGTQHPHDAAPCRCAGFCTLINIDFTFLNIQPLYLSGPVLLCPVYFECNSLFVSLLVRN